MPRVRAAAIDGTLQFLLDDQPFDDAIDLSGFDEVEVTQRAPSTPSYVLAGAASRGGRGSTRSRRRRSCATRSRSARSGARLLLRSETAPTCGGGAAGR